MPVKIGILHEKIKLDAKRSNSKRLEEALMKLMEGYSGVKVVVLPPYPFTGPLSVYEESKARRVIWSNAERVPTGLVKVKQSSVIATLTKWSYKYGVYIIGGPIIERAGPRVYLSLLAVSPKGLVFDKYRKVGLSRLEERLGISYGKKPGILNIEELKLTVGVFVDEDLAYPEFFRAIQAGNSNIIIGFYMPHESHYLGRVKNKNAAILTADLTLINSFLITRSKETGLPIILVGGAVEVSENGERLIAMPTIPVEPDTGIIDDEIRDVDDLGSHLIVEVDTNTSKPRQLRYPDLVTSKLSCKAIEEKAWRANMEPG